MDAINATKESCEVRGGLLRFVGTGDLLIQRNGLVASRGKASCEVPPVRPGKWYGWLARACESDRCRLSRLRFEGECYLGIAGRSVLSEVAGDAASGDWHVRTEALLCAPHAARRGSHLVKLLPGSLRNAIAFTALSLREGEKCHVAALSQAVEVRIAQGEELLVQPDALLAWQMAAGEKAASVPKAFVQKLRMIDLLVPRLPSQLRLRFQGPGKVLLAR